MNIEELFDFEYIESGEYWSVTHYYGRGEDVVFPESYKDIPVKTIGDWFSPYNKRIKRITIPEGYTSIGEQAFEGCMLLKEINFPESLTSIGERAFKNCILLTEIKLPKSLTSVGENAFSSCFMLKKIKLPEGLTSIWKYAFHNCPGLTDIKLPESLTSIGLGAFSYCKGLKDIKLPENLTSIDSCAFSDCTGLTNIKIPKSLTSISSDVFEGCTELAEINVDENNPVFCSVDGVMFDKAMTTLICFPEGKKGKYSVPDGIISIGRGAFFHKCKLTGISFTQSFLFNSYGFHGEHLTDFTVNELNPKYCSVDGVLFNKDKSKLISYPENKDRTDYTVPDGVIIIDTIAFLRCKHLINIVLPVSLKIIQDNAFLGCKELKIITLPMNLQYIGQGAFEFCPNLETITLSRKTKIVYEAFKGFNGKLVYMD